MRPLNTGHVLTKGVKIIAFLFASFGGFFYWIAPPEAAEARFSVGFASVLTLGLLLVIGALASRWGSRRTWKWWLLAFAVLLTAGSSLGFRYKTDLGKYAFPYPPELRDLNTIGGTTMQPNAAEDMYSNRWTKGELLANYGPENTNKIWSPESIEEAKSILRWEYTFFVVMLASALFCVAEGLLGRLPIK